MTYADAYKNYYAILKSGYSYKGLEMPTDYSVESASYETDQLVDTFVSMINSLRRYERDKEEHYLLLWLDKFKNAVDDKGQKLYEILRPLVVGPKPNFTKAFEIVELWRQGFISKVQSFEQIFNEWQLEFMQFSNKFIKTSAEKAIKKLGNDVVNLTPQQLIESILATIKEDWNKKYNTGKERELNFSKFMKDFDPYLTQIIADMKGIKEVWDNKNITLGEAFKIKEPKSLHASLKAKIIDGLVNGLSQEMFLVAFGEGASTARTQRELTYFSGKKQWVPTETDVYAILNFDLETNKNLTDKIKNMAQDSDIQLLIKSSDVANNFIIHYSSKDLSVSENSGSKSSIVAKIKGEGSIDSKIPALEQMGRAMGNYEAVHDLIFKIVNSGKDLIYDGTPGFIDKLSKGLTSLTFSFMFDDFERQFEQLRGNIEAQATELNLYMISGNYYAASDILFYLAQFVQGELKKSLISIGLKPTKTNFYLTEKNLDLLPEKERWITVRNDVMADTKMQVRMMTDNLRSLTYAIDRIKLPY